MNRGKKDGGDAKQTDKDGDTTSNKRVVINVGGVRHETFISTLERIPGTRLALLAQLQEADESYDPENGEYFFDQHPRAFECILHYYRTEELHMDKGVCGNVLKVVSGIIKLSNLVKLFTQTAFVIFNRASAYCFFVRI